jgi:uncharacterized coiled-coil protein SlyX
MPRPTIKELQTTIEAMEHTLTEKDKTIDTLMGNLGALENRLPAALERIDEVEENRRGLVGDYEKLLDEQVQTISDQRVAIVNLERGMAEQNEILDALITAYDGIEEAFHTEIARYQSQIVYVMGALDLINLYSGTNIESIKKITGAVVDEFRDEVRSWLGLEIDSGCCQGKSPDDPTCCKASDEDCGSVCSCQ